MSVGTARESNQGSRSQDSYTKLRAKLTRAVAASCPSWLSASRDDIVQAAVVRIMQIEKKGEGIEGLKSSYVEKVAYTAMVDEIRKHKRRREVELQEAAGANKWEKPARDNPERQAAASQIAASLRRCLGGLIRTRRLAVMAYLHGHTVPETARLLDWNPKKAENLVFRGLADLRICLEKKGIRP